MKNAITQLHNLSPEQLGNLLEQIVSTKFNDLKKFYHPKEPSIYLTRQKVAEFLSVDLSTVHNMTVKGILQKYQISGRVLYKLAEVENSIVKIKH